jgi:hypothetical protein
MGAPSLRWRGIRRFEPAIWFAAFFVYTDSFLALSKRPIDGSRRRWRFRIFDFHPGFRGARRIELPLRRGSFYLPLLAASCARFDLWLLYEG